MWTRLTAPGSWCLLGVACVVTSCSCAPRPREANSGGSGTETVAPSRPGKLVPLDPEIEAKHKEIWGGGISHVHQHGRSSDLGKGSFPKDPGVLLAPIETELTGLDGAAQRLGVGALAASLDLLKGIEPSPVPAQEARRLAMLGRLRQLQGDYKGSITAYEQLRAPSFQAFFPADVTAYALAQSHLRYAEQSEIPAAEKAQHRDEAATILQEVIDAPETRLRAAAEVQRALALSQLAGETGSPESLAALRELERVLTVYPNHPRVVQLALHRGLALERAGQAVPAAQALRDVALRYAGSSAASTAYREYERLADQSRLVTHEPWSFDEQLDRAKAARERRHVLWSRELLDDLFSSAKTKADKQAVARQRSWTSYYQRDFDRCIQDIELLPRGEQVSSYASLHNRCLERGEKYEKAVAQAKSVARRGASSRTRRKALWKAVDLAIRGGLYKQARKMYDEYARLTRRSSYDDKWTFAWLAYRQGRWSTAAREMYKLTRRSGVDGERARYYAAKVSLLRGGKARTQQAFREWKQLAESSPFSYYGLMAREQLLQNGQKLPDPPSLLPADPEIYPPFVQVRRSLEEAAERYGAAMVSAKRLSQLFASGYYEEARRELRWLSDQYLYNRAKVNRTRFLRPRDEGAVVGLSWAPKFSMPRPPVTGDTKAILADRSSADDLENRIRSAAVALREHYRVARHADTGAREYLSRWLLRAYRSVVEREAERYNIEASRLWALMYTESRFRRHVVSYVGARGALQIMPWTGRQLEQRLGLYEKQFNPDSLFDVRYNLKLAAYYVSELIQKFKGQAPLAYASYNGGPSNVARWLLAKAKSDAKPDLKLDDFIEEIPFGETYRYTKRVMEIEAAYQWMYHRKLPRWDLKLPSEVGDNIEF